ncbi:E2/UBC family protein [Chitinophaga ginsengisegetis]|uniref:E2/UBC family protein n=1 Tax=Chitinophaga ginsengisegetis TaxID=393003 RepID=UPI0009A8504E|nr:E2/UBC family protein [Chitinophaga ginsengisegetis]
MDNSFLPLKDRSFLKSKGFTYREINDGVQKGIIIDNFSIHPEGKFSSNSASLLILLPNGYPDVAPDMFYFIPALRLINTGSLPAQADQILTFHGATWQRWSRHGPPDAWRPGTDGLQSYLQRVFNALNAA